MATIIHSFDDALALLGKGSNEVAIQNPPGSIFYAGLGYFKALQDEIIRRFPDVTLHFTLDCGDDAAVVQQAAKAGFSDIVFSGAEEVFVKLQQIGDLTGTVIHKQ